MNPDTDELLDTVEAFLAMPGVDAACQCDPAVYREPCPFCRLIDEVDRLRGRKSRRG